MKTQKHMPVKKVLFLNPFSDECVKADSIEKKIANGHIACEAPLGLLYVFTYARNSFPNISFRIYDAHAQLFEFAHKGMEYNWNKLINGIVDFNPDVIGIGAYYYKSIKLFNEVCSRIKTVLPKVKIIAGGNYATESTSMMMQNQNVDFAILSEGEVKFVEFLSKYISNQSFNNLEGFAYRKETGEVVINKKTYYIKDLSTIPIPDRSVLPMHLYGQGREALDRVYPGDRKLSMTISRGCPYQCSFCTAKIFWGRRIRYRETESVLDEMEILKNEYGAEIIIINDDNFLVDRKRAEAIMKGMIRRNLNIKWIAGGGSSVRALNNDNFLDLVVKSGYCFFNLAIESSSNETLKRIRKPVTVEESIELVSKIRNRYPHMYINAFFIVGFPFEKKIDIINTLELSHQLDLDWASHYIFHPFPNTELYDYCIENEIIKEANLNYGENYKESEINGIDWTNKWLFEKNYEYNLKVNFLNNRNIRNKNYKQAFRDFEYILQLAPGHALAYRFASIAASKIGDNEKTLYYNKQEDCILKKRNSEFNKWYKLLKI